MLCFLLFGQHRENVVIKVCMLSQLHEHQFVVQVLHNKSRCWTECFMHCKNFLNNCSGICLQICTFSCSYTEAVTLRWVMVSVAGSDSENYPPSHPASSCVGLSSLAFSATNVFNYCFLGISSLKEERSDREESLYQICCN